LVDGSEEKRGYNDYGEITEKATVHIAHEKVCQWPWKIHA